uniref:Ubiquitin-conjugating enzyme E2 Z n=1 Tax=viral metagenome TaxID=1070528 RepID=A0A6C0CRC0_9ZZZZ
MEDGNNYIPMDTKKRIAKDVIEINKYPLHKHGIYYFHDEENLKKGYALIIGPDETIYQDGFYYFEFTFPSNYPASPPKAKFITGDGKTRFHPNLYRNGKVCLSLLNTWRGESWTSCQSISTILLTLVTLFHNKPLLNEPGCTEKHKDFKKYNEIVEYKNYDIAILNGLRHKENNNWYGKQFNIFNDIVSNHIINNYSKIIKRLEDSLKKKETTKYRTSIYSMEIDVNYEVLLSKFKSISQNK